MSVIRFNSDIFTTDSSEYEILYNAAILIKGVDGAVLEIGTREGGSAKIIIDALTNNQDTNRSMFCVDPYGNIEYPLTHISAGFQFGPEFSKTTDNPQSKKDIIKVRLGHTNDMRRKIIPSLYYYAYQSGLNFSFFSLEDTEFMKRFEDGVPVYDDFKKIEDKYALVFFDGPHTNEIVKYETEFFVPRTNIGSVLVYDDIWMYDHDRAENYLLDNGFTVLNKGNVKASYKKVG
jgi:hypothetical protein